MTINSELENQLTSPQETSKLLRVTVDTLGVWRCTKRYQLPYVKVGRKVFYRIDDIKKFIEQRTFCKTVVE